MRRHLFSFVAVACSLAMCEAAAAQTPPPLDRIVGADVLGRPLVITALTGISVGALAAAARVPMGLEATGPATVQPWRVDASGQTVRAVLDAIVAADPRYEWRADNGVVVFRPVWAWTDMTDVLLRGVGSIKLDDVQASDVMRIVARLFGETLFPGSGPGDPKRFSVNLPPGSVIEALDGIVRAHGTMAWAFEPTTPTPLAPGSVSSPYTVSLIGGRVGAAFGVGVSANAAPPTSVDVDVDPSRPAPFTEPILDRIVRTKRNGQPLILESIFGVSELAEAAGVTMGIELLPATEPRALSGGIQVTGMSLRDALSAFTAADSRYEWRDMDGVVVIRPIAAWFDSAHPLSREVTGVRLDSATISEVIRVEQSLLDPEVRNGPSVDPLLDARRVSVTLPHGTQLDLLNAIARSHGRLCWVLEENNDRDTQFFGGRRHMLTFRVGGSGKGFAFP
jgi:hypothetical protein